MRRSAVSSIATILLLTLPVEFLPAAESNPYVAVFSDGTVLEGELLRFWNDPQGKPELEGVSLFDSNNPARWIRDRRLREKAYKYAAESFVEFIGGDRLPGKVVSASFETQGSSPSYLRVDTDGAFARPGTVARKYFRVFPSKVQRIVWRRIDRQVLTPGVAYLRDGQTVEFRRLRWGEASVYLLLSDGVKEFAFGELAEIHPLTGDPWESYYDDLAILSPNLRESLFQFESVDGLIVTSSSGRFQALGYSSLEEQERLGRVRETLKGQLNNFKQQNKVALEKIKALELKLDEELKKQAAAQTPDKRQEDRVREASVRHLSQMEKRHRRRLESHDRLTVSQEKIRLRQLKKLPEDKRKVQVEAFRRDRLRQREQIERQNADEVRRTRAQRQQEDQRRIDRIRALKRDQLKRARKSKTAEQLFSRVDEYNEWLAAMEKVKVRVEMLQGDQGGPETWQHMAHPAWSLDPVWTPFNKIHTYSFFKPEEIPLSRLYPVVFKERHFLAKDAGWRLNRNSRNAFLASASRAYGWGYAVHAYSELHFDLHPLVMAFRSHLGLDRRVGDGGCAIGRVFLGSLEGNPLYESPFLVGSHQAVDTGRLELAAAAEGRKRRLILQADTAHDDGISSVDPFDIRDMVDWLEPMLQLDRERLATLVSNRVHLNVPAWRNWTPTIGAAAVCDWRVVFENRGEGYFFPALSLQGAPVILSRTVQPSEARKWLQVDMSQVNVLRPDASRLVVRLDGKELEPAELPRRQPWQVGSIPLLYDLGVNRDAPAAIEVTQNPGKELICWRKLEIVNGPSAVYELSTLLEEAGGKDLQLTQAIARVLKSARLDFEEKKAALQLYQKGAEINYRRKAPVATIKILGSKDLWKVAASHSSTDEFKPRNAIDGNPDTRWTSQASQQPGMWFSVEFPGPTLIGGVRLKGQGNNDHPVGYQIFSSLDGVKWSGILAQGVGSSPVTESIFQSVEAKFLRIVQTGKTTLWWSINEIQVLEPATVDVVSSVLLGEKWHGDDEDLAVLKKVPTLGTVHLSGQLKNTPEALADLRQSLGFIAFEEHERIPSHSGTPTCDFKVINKTDKLLKIIWIGFDSVYTPYPDLGARETSIRKSYVGHRWEAQLDGRRLGFYVVEPGLEWVITDEK